MLRLADGKKLLLTKKMYLFVKCKHIMKNHPKVLHTVYDIGLSLRQLVDSGGPNRSTSVFCFVIIKKFWDIQSLMSWIQSNRGHRVD